ncbi:galanin receptor 2a-like [Montipora capricornis]|uniref:galanin receptor 2a-like n=1 Tax=Montipora capricornis TaxID=246305 RepID=UPI0035F1A340
MAVFSSYHNSKSAFNVTLWTLQEMIVVVGIIQNALILFIVLKNKTMHTTTNYLLANLAAADLVSLIFCPIRMALDITDNHIGGMAGQVICKAFTGNFLPKLAKCAGFTSLIFLATDRYNAIATPFIIRYRLTKNNIGFAIGLTWALAVTFCLPFVIWSDFNEKTKRCLDPWSIEKGASMKIYIMAINIMFLGGACLLMFCYVQILRGIFITRTICSGNVACGDHAQLAAKKKLAQTSLVVSVSFCTCYSPSLFFQLYLALTAPETVETVNQNYETMYVVHSLASFILLLGSCLNPLLYAFQSSNYRENLKRIFTKKTRRCTVGPATVGLEFIKNTSMKCNRRQLPGISSFR